MAGAFAAGLGDTVVKIGMQVLFAVCAIVVLTILFFASKAGFKWYKERKNYKVDVVIFNNDGTWYTDKTGKFTTGDHIDKMVFLKTKETMPVIDTKYIRARKLTLWRYAPNQYAVVPPNIWNQNPSKFGIEVINYQMKNFAYLEQRAAVSRWAYLKDLLQRYAPYITAVMILIFTGVIIYLIMKTALGMYGDIVAARTIECAKIIGSSPAVPVS